MNTEHAVVFPALIHQGFIIYIALNMEVNGIERNKQSIEKTDYLKIHATSLLLPSMGLDGLMQNLKM